MRNGYITDTLTSVDIKEILQIGGKLIGIYEGVKYKENFKVIPSKRVNGKLFEFIKKKHKDHGDEVMKMLVKLFLVFFVENKYEEILNKNMLRNQNFGRWVNMMKELKNIGV